MFLFKQNLYKKIFTDENINEAWRHIRPKSKIAGVDGIGADMFQRHLLKNLKDIQEKLRARRYSPGPIKQFSIQKPDGSKRTLGILTVRDKIVQRAVFQVIEHVFDAGFEDCSYAFRKGLSVETALAHVNNLVGKGNYWVVHVDIERFFDNIDTGILFGLIAEKLKDREVLRMIRSWLDAEARIMEKKRFLFHRVKKGILQGSVLSPLYANIYLDPFDKKARQSGLMHVRFADNILAVTPNEKDAKRALKTIRRILRRLKLRLNERKTVVTHLENRITFLGKKLLLMKTGKNAWLSIQDKQNPAISQQLFHLHKHQENCSAAAN